MSKRPGNTADAEPTCYFRVFIDVTRIIIVNEVVPERLTKNKPCQAPPEQMQMPIVSHPWLAVGELID